MKIFNKEISKKTVKLVIGGIVAAVVGTTIIAVTNHNNKEPEVQEDVEMIEIGLQDDELIEE